MANIVSANQLLLSSGDYSDLTLVCEDQEFQVHKAIVCTQSPVVAAAMKGGYKEAQTNTFHIADFKPTTVKCMLDYMYTGKYEEVPPGCSDDNKGQDSTSKEISATWLYHGLVNCIADYFRLPGLASLATVTLDKLIHKDWSAAAFCCLLSGTREKTGDDDFRVMMAARAADHIGELLAWDLFDGSDPNDDMTPTVLRMCVEKAEAEVARAKEITKEIARLLASGSFRFAPAPKKSQFIAPKTDSAFTQQGFGMGTGEYGIDCNVYERS
ncbi:hypothetical protein NUW58_g2997 [Xylaria curta]|uniref:Uncharacterized protein n=1 Tax=Xylaria curta TaxID=42375 RepID=A0ACC1PFM7_9PEZI|nr:hypothetical protein NUW58_g2997 [Xylaria curta]